MGTAEESFAAQCAYRLVGLVHPYEGHIGRRDWLMLCDQLRMMASFLEAFQVLAVPSTPMNQGTRIR